VLVIDGIVESRQLVAFPPKRDRRRRAAVVGLEAIDSDLNAAISDVNTRSLLEHEELENRIADPGRGVVPWSGLRRLRRSAASPI
jgi:hypothetical protein